MLHLTVDGKPYQLAQGWGELTEKQVMALMPLRLTDPAVPANCLKALRVLLPIGAKLIRRTDAEDLLRILDQIAWLWSSEVGTTPIISFSHQGTTYHLPEPDLDSVVVFEYAMADHFLRAFSTNQAGQGQLDLLVATLCRPQAKKLNRMDPDWNGDVREKYNSKIAEARAMLFCDLPIQLKMVVLYHFIAGQRSIHRKYKEIFLEPGEGQSHGNTGPDFGWLGLIDNLAEQGTFGDWDKTAYSPLHTVCFHLWKKHFQLKEQRKNL